MAIQPDLVGTITLSGGSTAFTWTGTSLVSAAIQAGDEIRLPGKAMVLTIATVTSATAGTLTDNCPAAAAGSGQAARVRYQSDLSRVAAQTRQLIELLSGKGFFKYDAAGSLAERDDYDTRPQGFAYLNIDTDPMELYVKASDASGDWAGPVSYATGPTGPAPNMSVGTTDTGAAGTDADVTIDGTNPNYTLNFTIPRGDTGVQGPLGPAGFRVSAVGELTDRTTYDAEDAGFSFVATDGDGVSITEPVVFVKLSSASANWSDAVPFGASAIGSMAESVYDPDEIGMDVFGGGLRLPTRSAIAAMSIAASVGYIQTAGDVAPGDGGHTLFKRVGVAPSHQFYEPSADGSYFEGAPVPSISLRALGGVGDGATFEDISALNAKLAGAAAVGIRVFDGLDRTYRLDGATGLAIPQGCTLRNFRLDAQEMDVASRAINVTGTQGSAVSLTADCLYGTYTWACDTTGLTAGDLVFLGTDKIWNSTLKYGEMNRIYSVDGPTSLTLTTAVSNDFLVSDSAILRKLSGAAGAALEDFEMIGSGAGGEQYALDLRYASSLMLSRGVIRKFDDRCIHAVQCMDVKLDDMDLREATRASFSYGVALFGCRNFEWGGGSATKFRHAVDASSSVQGITINTKVHHVELRRVIGGLGAHYGSMDLDYSHNTFYGDDPQGTNIAAISVEGANLTAVGNRFRNVSDIAISHTPNQTGAKKPSRTVASLNDFENVPKAAIRIDPLSSAEIGAVSVVGNTGRTIGAELVSEGAIYIRSGAAPVKGVAVVGNGFADLRCHGLVLSAVDPNPIDVAALGGNAFAIEASLQATKSAIRSTGTGLVRHQAMVGNASDTETTGYLSQGDKEVILGNAAFDASIAVSSTATDRNLGPTYTLNKVLSGAVSTGFYEFDVGKFLRRKVRIIGIYGKTSAGSATVRLGVDGVSSGHTSININTTLGGTAYSTPPIVDGATSIKTLSLQVASVSSASDLDVQIIYQDL